MYYDVNDSFNSRSSGCCAAMMLMHHGKGILPMERPCSILNRTTQPLYICSNKKNTSSCLTMFNCKTLDDIGEYYLKHNYLVAFYLL